jgi:hypothetical protein
VGERWIDGRGRCVTVILLDRGHGPQPYLRVTWHHQILLGAGYYRHVEDALALVDIESLVEIVPLPPNRARP